MVLATALQNLRTNLHGLTALNVNYEFFVDRLVLHLHISLHITKAGAGAGIVRYVAHHRERQCTGSVSKQSLSEQRIQGKQAM